jgi:hypothetical protein
VSFSLPPLSLDNAAHVTDNVNAIPAKFRVVFGRAAPAPMPREESSPYSVEIEMHPSANCEDSGAPDLLLLLKQTT